MTRVQRFYGRSYSYISTDRRGNEAVEYEVAGLSGMVVHFRLVRFVVLKMAYVYNSLSFAEACLSVKCLPLGRYFRE